MPTLHELMSLCPLWPLSFIPSRKGRIFDIGAERKSGREARRIDYLLFFSVLICVHLRLGYSLKVKLGI